MALLSFTAKYCRKFFLLFLGIGKHLFAHFVTRPKKNASHKEIAAAAGFSISKMSQEYN